MSQEIGVAHVTVMPSARGFGKAVEGEVDSGLGGATKKADGRLKTLAKNTAKWGAVAVAAVGASIAGLAIKGGIDRALNIEDAQAKLKGLGHDTQSVDQIMTDALASVRGTAYGLDSAATTAASAVASGIKPGKELEGYLRLTADAATIAGVSMEEMGSIINKTTAKGRVGMDDLNRLTERGIPILQFLADEYGVTAEEMSKMVSAGEVDSERFRKALEENVGGAALASGDTTRGAFANMGAALSRLGLSVVQPFVDNAKGLFGELTTIIDGLNDRIAPFAEKFSEWFGGKMSDSLEGFGDRFLAALDSMTSGLANFSFGDMLTGLTSAIQSGVLSAANWLADGGIQTLVDGFISGREKLFGAVVDMVPGIMDALLTLIPALGDLAVQVVTAIAALAPEIASTLVTMIPALLDTAIVVFLAIVDALVATVPVLIETLVGVLPGLIETLVGMVPQLLLAGIGLFLALVDAVVEVLPGLIETLLGMLPGLIETLLGMVPVLLEAATTLFLALVDALMLMLPDLLDTLLNDVLPTVLATLIEMAPELQAAGLELFVALVEALTEMLPMLIDMLLGTVFPTLAQTLIDLVPELISTGITLFLALVDALMDIVPDLLVAVGSVIASLLAALLENAPKMLAGAFDLFMNVLDGFEDVWPDIWDWVKSIPGKLLDGLGDLGSMLWDAGAKIINGLWEGLQSGFDTIKDGLKDLTSKLPDWKGPAQRDANLLTGAGQLVMGGFLDGLQDGEGTIKRYLTGLTGELGMTASMSVSAAGVGAGPGPLSRDDLLSFAREIVAAFREDGDGRTGAALARLSSHSQTLTRMGW